MLLTKKPSLFRTSMLSACLLYSVALSACAPVKATRGNLLEPEQIEQIRLGQHHKSDVMQILGTPTTKAIFDENKWYYVGMHTEQTAFLDPEIKEKTILTVEFDENDMVTAMSIIDHEGYDVPISSRQTPTSGQDMTVIQQILGNVGRFNSDGSLAQ